MSFVIPRLILLNRKLEVKYLGNRIKSIVYFIKFP
jgi:hypothetical protein